MADALIPGSLAARVLDRLTTTREEFEAYELAEALQVDEGEIRAAIGTLRRICRLTTRLEEGHPIYRAAGTAPDTIPGSALKVIGEKKKPVAETKAPAIETKPAKRETEPPMAKKPSQESAKPDTLRTRILQTLEAKPGMKSDGVAKALGIKRGNATVGLCELAKDGLVQRVGKRPYGWVVTNGSKPIEAAAPTAKKAASKKAKRARNLADFGAVPADAPKGGIVFAIDACGTVGIGHLRLKPAQVMSLVDFLERTQHVWKGARP